MVYKILLTTFLFAAFQGFLHADIRIYLLPVVELQDSSPRLKDIARVDCDPEIRKSVEDIELSASLYRDGYIDRREIGALVRSNTMDLVFIYGNAVRVGKITGSEVNDIILTDKSCVKSGDKLSVIVNKNGITIELSGEAMEEGKMGDEIYVKLSDARKIKGVVKGFRIVEVTL